MVKKKEKRVEIIENKIISKKINYWMIASVILACLLLITGLIAMTSGISAKTAEKKFIEFAQTQGADVEIIGVESIGDIYEITFDFAGQEGKFHITKDGRYIGQMMELTPSESPLNPNTNTDVPKTERPKVELYVWSYCPYGVQAQGPMAAVANLLKNSADFEIVPYYDGHGQYETQQNQIQACIQKLDGDKYWNYAEGFVKTIYSKCGISGDAECDKTESIGLMKTLGINSDQVMACVNSEGIVLNNAAASKAQTNGVTGSPTIIINGIKINVARDSESIKTAVCSAYTTTPVECEEVLDSSAAAAAGSC